MYINKSLSFLEQTVIALAEKNRAHVPFRHSKLTHALKVGCSSMFVHGKVVKKTFLEVGQQSFYRKTPGHLGQLDIFKE